MTEELKNFLNDCKKSILFYTISYFVIFMILKLIVNLLGFEFMKYIYIFSTIVIICGIIASIVKAFKSKSKSTRICIAICVLSVIIIGCSVFGRLALLLVAFSFNPEHIVKIENKKYVAYVYAWLDTRVDYYDYINPFVRGTTKRISDYYDNIGLDVLDSEHKGLYNPNYTNYYDENGKLINRNPYIVKENTDANKDDETKYNEYMEQQNRQYEESKTITSNSSNDILYEKVISEDTVIRVRSLGAILAQRSIIQVEKSTDGGKTFTVVSDEGISIHNSSEFIFIDENIGFINDPGLAGTDGENRGLLVTIDSGKSFKNANIIHPYNIEEKNLFVKGVPYIKEGILKIQIYTLKHYERTYYIFTSNDNGLNWILEK